MRRVGNIILIGTAHISQQSIDEVKRVIDEEKPDVVAVELCESRYRALRGEVKELNIKDVLRGGIWMPVFQLILSHMQRRFGEKYGVMPGAEMITAIAYAREVGARVELVDRDIGVTMRRFWNAMGSLEKLKFLWILLSSMVKEEEIDTEKLTSGDIVSQLIDEFRKFSPKAASVLIDERDSYIASKLLSLSSHGKVVAVVGAGHVDGIERRLRDPSLIKLDVCERRRFPVSKIAGGVFTALVAFFIASLLLSGVPLMILLRALMYWFIITGSLSAAGAMIGRGHPLSILTAFCVAWITTLHPLLAAGWFAGIVEAWIRKPSVEDMRKMMSSDSFSELMRNPFFRVLLVTALANVGATIGFFIGAYVVLSFTGIDLGKLIGI